MGGNVLLYFVVVLSSGEILSFLAIFITKVDQFLFSCKLHFDNFSQYFLFYEIIHSLFFISCIFYIP